MGITNLVLNGFFAWLVFKALDLIPLWGIKDSIAFDLSITGFLLGFLVCLGVSFGARKKMPKHALATLQITQLGLAGLLPENLWLRSFLIGILGLVLGWITIGAIALSSATALSLNTYIAIKAVAAALFALACNHCTVVRAFADIGSPASVATDAT